MVEEYVAGNTYESILLKRRRENRIFSELEALKILAQLLPVLHYLHKRNIIHRDMSPNNLMRAKDRPRPVLIDFGVVKHFWDEENVDASIMAGKRGYSPSEQMLYGKCYPVSDLYALGATLIALLTGRYPNKHIDPENQT